MKVVLNIQPISPVENTMRIAKDLQGINFNCSIACDDGEAGNKDSFNF